jgi:preprotein translocase subunit SecF
MTARTIVGLCAIVALLGVSIYLLAQIPWEFAVGGVLALVGIFILVGHDAPDAL